MVSANGWWEHACTSDGKFASTRPGGGRLRRCAGDVRRIPLLQGLRGGAGGERAAGGPAVDVAAPGLHPPRPCPSGHRRHRGDAQAEEGARDRRDSHHHADRERAAEDAGRGAEGGMRRRGGEALHARGAARDRAGLREGQNRLIPGDWYRSISKVPVWKWNELPHVNETRDRMQGESVPSRPCRSMTRWVVTQAAPASVHSASKNQNGRVCCWTPTPSHRSILRPSTVQELPSPQ